MIEVVSEHGTRQGANRYISRAGLGAQMSGYTMLCKVSE